MDRLTYRSSMGDYGSAKHFEDEWEEKCALRNTLGKYEDLGYTPEELEVIIKYVKSLEERGFKSYAEMKGNI